MENNYNKSLHAFKNKIIQSLKDIELTELKKGFLHEHVVPLATYAPWKSDKDFVEIYNAIRDNTLVDIYRCHELWTLAKQVAGLDGEVIEVGVWKGGTGAIMAKALENQQSHVHLVDTFKGVVKAGVEDSNYKGGEHCDTSLEVVKELLKKLSLDGVNIRRGIFPDDLKNMFDKQQFKLCHIDVDTYLSAKDILDFVWPRLVKGGLVVFDDYGFWGCEGVTKLFDDLNLKDCLKIHNLNGHGLLIKF